MGLTRKPDAMVSAELRAARRLFRAAKEMLRFPEENGGRLILEVDCMRLVDAIEAYAKLARERKAKGKKK